MIEELKRLALAATPGPWYASDFYGLSETTDQFERTIRTKDCDFIAAVNPQAILKLIARIEKLEAVVEAAGDLWDHCTVEPVYEDVNERFRKALVALNDVQQPGND